MNVVMTGDGRFVEVQGTAEGEPFDRELLDALLDLAGQGLRRPDRHAAGGARGDPRERVQAVPTRARDARSSSRPATTHKVDELRADPR